MGAHIVCRSQPSRCHRCARKQLSGPLHDGNGPHNSRPPQPGDRSASEMGWSLQGRAERVSHRLHRCALDVEALELPLELIHRLRNLSVPGSRHRRDQKSATWSVVCMSLRLPRTMGVQRQRRSRHPPQLHKLCERRPVRARTCSRLFALRAFSRLLTMPANDLLMRFIFACVSSRLTTASRREAS